MRKGTTTIQKKFRNLVTYLLCVTCMLSVAIFFVGCDNQTTELTPGYHYAAYEGKTEKGESFLACGTGGRLDRIYSDKTSEPIPLPGVDTDLTHILIGQGLALVGGQAGTLLYGRDGAGFTPCEKFTKADIVGLTFFHNQYFAATRDGIVYSSADGVSWTKAAGLSGKNIVGMAATADSISAVTAETDIFISPDGVEWTSQNYNKTYDGLVDDKYVFTNIVDSGSSLIILGNPVGNPDSPTIMHTENGGETWSFIVLGEINYTPPEEFYPMSANFLVPFAGQTFLACNKGRILLVSDCFQCHTIFDVMKEDLRGLAAGEGHLLAVGDNFEFAVLTEDYLQYLRVTPEEAYEFYMYNNALIIDVRSEEQYDEEHIKDSISIPLDELKIKLPAEVPEKDAVVLFYCTSGILAQEAAKTAQLLGYQNAFNMGGITDWPYDTE